MAFKKVGTVVARGQSLKKVGTVEKEGEDIDRIVSDRVEKILKERDRIDLWKKKAAQFKAEAREPYRKLAEDQGALKSFAIGAGKGLTDVGRGVGRLFGGDYSKAIEEEKAGYQALQEASPISTGLGEVAGETLPFIPVAMGAGGAAAAGHLGPQAARILGTKAGQIALASGLGAMEGATSSAGRGDDLGDIAKTGTISGTAAAASETFLPPLARGVSKVARKTGLPKAVRKLYEKGFKKVTKKMPKGSMVTATGAPTREVDKALDEYGLSTAKIKPEDTEVVKDALLKLEPHTDPKEAARFAFLERYGFTGDTAPTKANIERTADAWQNQQEAIKRSTMVRGRVESQNALVKDRFDDVRDKTGGVIDSSTSPVFNAVLNKSTDISNEIGLMYDIAGKTTEKKRTISPKHTLRTLRKIISQGDDDLAGGLVSNLKKILKKRNLIVEDSGKLSPGRKMNVKEAENLIQVINKRYSKSDKNQNRIARHLKDAIDDDVMKSGGSDLFKQARKLKASFHRDLERTAESGFSKRGVSLPKDILESKIDPDELFKKAIISKKYWATEVKDLKKYLTESGTTPQKLAGKRAWDDLRAETMDWIKDESFGGPIDQLENRTITRARLERTLKKIGDNKRDVLFTKKENKFLDETLSALKLLEPVGGTQQGKGPSAQAVEAAFKKWAAIRRISESSEILKSFSDLQIAKGTLVGKPTARKPKTMSKVIGPTGAAIGDRMTDERGQDQDE